MKKIIVAVDSFKGSMTSLEAGNAIRNGIKDIHPDWNITVYPVADGGEGTLEALTYHQSVTERTCTVTGPLGDHVEASYLWYERDSERIAVIEMAQAAGLPLVPIDKRNPLYTTTYGVGELIRDAIDQGCRKFIIGIGGSATNDAGIGMLQALGYHFYDRDGRDISFGAKELAKITDIGFEDVIRDLSSCRFQIACDVKNPFVGEQGCSRVYGHQKGATAIDVEKMDRSMAQFADLVERIAASGRKGIFPNGDRNTPGAGAAGGLGYAFLMFLDGVLRPGIDIVLDEIRLEEAIAQADLVITGEGRLDGQTAMGKAPVGVARLAKKHNIPVIAFAGSVTKEAIACNQNGIDAFFPILRGVTTLEDAMKPENAKANMADTVEQVFRLLNIRRK